MLDNFAQFGLIILIVLGVSFLVRILRQPLIIGYIISGIVVGPFFLNIVTNNPTLTTFSEMGISFLLFIVGLYLSPKIIKEVGKVSLITGLGQIIFTTLIGFIIAITYGFNWITSLYISIAFTFSSTIIIMKLLSDKDALEKLYGKISIGFLLLQDIVAVILLIIVSSYTKGNDTYTLIFFSLLKGIILLSILTPISYFALPKLTEFFAKSQEFLFLFSLSWGFGLSLLFLYFGFSIEIGALIAGVMLSMSPYSYEIASKLKPLRDFFIISFFVILGGQMTFGDISGLIWPIILFSLYILIGNPLIVMVLMGFFGYSKKTGFLAGLTMSQISEFSLILIALGVKTGALTQEILSFVTITGLITIAGSTYMIMYSEFIYDKIAHLLNIFEKKKLREKEIFSREYKYILLGENRSGYSIMKSFINLKKDYIIVDYNPIRVKDLCKKGINCVYGDASNPDFLEELDLADAEIIVSTVPEKEVNELVLRILKRVHPSKRPVVILTCREIRDVFDLYKKGADYVILPQFLGGEYASKLIMDYKNNKKEYIKERNKQILELKKRFR